MRAAMALVTVLVIGASVYFSGADQAVSTAPEPMWVKFVFGADGQTAAWTGRLTVKDGKALALSEWGLEAADAVDPASFSWRIRSVQHKPGDKRPKYDLHSSFAESVRGILVKIESTALTSIRVETEQGNFEVKPVELTAGRPTPLLAGRATAELLGTADVVAKTKTEDDFAAVAVTTNGQRFVAWIAFNDDQQRDHLLVRDIKDPASKPEVIAAGTEFASVRLLAGPDGLLRAVWCSPGANKDWDLYSATRNRTGWSAAERLTSAARADFHVVADQGPDGRVWLAWQSFRNGNSDIYAKCLSEGKWSEDIPIAASSANEWEPAISVDANGVAWIGYDTYEHGNYDVYLVSVSYRDGQAQVSERIAIARSEEFEAHASVLADRAGRVWVAYGIAGANWGKDFTGDSPYRNGSYIEPLHATRRLGLRCVVDGKVQQPTVALPQDVKSGRVRSLNRLVFGDQTHFYEYPQLALDGAGRVWLFFRLNRQGFVGAPRKGFVWDIFATTYTEKGWLQPIQLPHSEGRQNQRVSWAAGQDGHLHCAWSEGNHYVSVERKYSVHHGTLPTIAEPPGKMPLKPVEVEAPGKPDAAVEAPWKLKRGGEDYVLCFGDLHRHTNTSFCGGTIDGSLVDAQRYALDAAQLDFLAVTDHTRDVTAYPWWRSQKTADLFHVPGHYCPIYGYERSNDTANGGHRNVFLLERGKDLMNRSDCYYKDRQVGHPDTRPDTTLYPWLKQTGNGFTIAHTPAYDAKNKRGTWDFNDADTEPVVEIFQAFRYSYERPDRRVSREASVWHALEKGYKLGFIASSDHFSTHLSYACVWAKEKNRPALFEAIRARRTYAATDRIALDFRIGTAVMGEETRLGNDKPVLTIRAVGTGAIDDIEVIRSGEVIATLHPKQRTIEMTYTDPQPVAGASYYYVRLRQNDDAYAWASPIWVRR